MRPQVTLSHTLTKTQLNKLIGFKKQLRGWLGPRPSLAEAVYLWGELWALEVPRLPCSGKSRTPAPAQSLWASW